MSKHKIINTQCKTGACYRNTKWLRLIIYKMKHTLWPLMCAECRLPLILLVASPFAYLPHELHFLETEELLSIVSFLPAEPTEYSEKKSDVSTIFLFQEKRKPNCKLYNRHNINKTINI